METCLTNPFLDCEWRCAWDLRWRLRVGSAQDTSAPAAGSSNELGDIIVTARRVEERLQDVPISIQVFNQQQLTERNVTNSNELAQYTPSLSTNPNFGTDETTFAIRGFNQDQGSPPSVGSTSPTSSRRAATATAFRSAMARLTATSSILPTFRC
jgi:outer membrane receptor protein involved in Fe transport